MTRNLYESDLAAIRLESWKRGIPVVDLPPKLEWLFAGEARYRAAFGGRGSGKSRSFGKMSAVWAYMCAEMGMQGVILCARETMNSLEESSMEEVKFAIHSEPWLDAYFDIGKKYIRTKNERVSYAFTGLQTGIQGLKSKARILLAWVEEAEFTTEHGWNILVPTVREADSEIWATYNPEMDGSPTDQRFVKTSRDDMKVVELNYRDNPWFPEVLEKERQEAQKRLDDQTYAWIWEGSYRENSDAQVFGKKYRIAEFEPSADWHGPYQGIDWGFANDPTFATRSWIQDGTLYIEREAVKVGLELDDTASFITRKIPEFERYVSRADSARPESISYVNRHGLSRCTKADKWSGSVEDGIEHLKSYKEIVIHPRCEEMIKEARLYSYKTDKLTGDVLPKIQDAYNHGWDSVRYALDPLIQNHNPAQTLNVTMPM